MVKLAAEDVKALELKCPKFCRRDAEEIRSAMNRGEIFRSFSKTEQERILKEAASFDYIIPSLRTFFQDIYLLDDCATSIKYLLKPDRTTVRAALQRNFNVQRFQRPQPAQGLAPPRPFGDAIRALWIFALGNFLKLPKPSARRDNRLLAKTLSEEASQGTIQTFARLAQNLGFWSREIEFLTHARPDSELNGGPDADGSLIGQIDQLEHADVPTTSLLLLNFTGDKRHLQRRCGRPRYETYHQLRTFLNKGFLHYDYGKLSIDGPDIAPFLILRSQYLAFFNIPDHLCRRHESNPPEIDEQALELVAVPPAFEHSILESREDTASQYTDITVESIDDKRRDYEECSTVALQETQSEVHNDTIQIAFKTFEKGKFVTVAQIDAGQPREVLNTATALMRVQGMKHFSVALEPIAVDQCFQAAKDSGLNTVIVLPANNFEISADIRRAAGQLRAH
ncbi:hypothetical protein O9K51_11397 [Purpureocillium lavendulum]|uniref:Uncharacterized protein n=1 Tax=Purpureocillium lavendulum TaxID=1247861 RepID=A0AB34FBN5_9HYPO|nr:hypothetical protein O9K51_11397 [Purpureocillium lavendulum]